MAVLRISNFFKIFDLIFLVFNFINLLSTLVCGYF